MNAPRTATKLTPASVRRDQASPNGSHRNSRNTAIAPYGSTRGGVISTTPLNAAGTGRDHRPAPASCSRDILPLRRLRERTPCDWRMSYRRVHDEIATVRLTPNAFHGAWNYAIHPWS